MLGPRTPGPIPARLGILLLVRGGGMNPRELERARQLEALGFLGITLQGRLNSGFTSGWKLVLPKAA